MAQGMSLRGSDAVAASAGVLQAGLQIQANLLDQSGVLIEEGVDALQGGVKTDAQPAQFQPWLRNYQKLKATFERICARNHKLLRPDNYP